MSDDDPGLLGSLPRARPGTRSAKRNEARQPPAGRQPPPAGESDPEQAGDRIGGVVRAAAEAAGTGLRAADALTRGVLRRLPRR